MRSGPWRALVAPGFENGYLVRDSVSTRGVPLSVGGSLGRRTGIDSEVLSRRVAGQRRSCGVERGDRVGNQSAISLIGHVCHGYKERPATHTAAIPDTRGPPCNHGAAGGG